MSQTKAQLISDLVQALNFTGTATAPANGLFLSEANKLAFATASTERLKLAGTEVVVNETGANTDFRVEGDTNINLLFCDAGNDRVGIGINNPATALSVGGVIKSNVDANDGTSTAIRTENGGTGTTIASYGFASGNSQKASIRAHVLGNGAMMFHNNNDTEKMRIDASGNVGIGTSSPDAKLKINGSSAYTVANSGQSVEGLDIQATAGGSGNFGGAISLGASGSGRSAIAALQDGADSDRTGLVFITHDSNTAADNSEEKMRIDSSGNVGIGTTSPSQLLHLKKTGSNALLFVERDSGALAFLEAQASKVTLGSSNNHPVHIVQNSGDALMIDSSKRVLLATTSASGADSTADDLVIGNTAQGNNGMTIVTAATNTGAFFFADQDGTVRGGVRYQHGNDRAQFYAGGNVVLNLQNKGVGINETSVAADALTIRGGDTDDTPSLILKRATDGTQSSGEIIGKLQFTTNENNVDSGNYQPRVEIQGEITDNVGGAAMVLYTAAGSATSPSERMRITSGGNVLIGTTSSEDTTGNSGPKLLHTGDLQIDGDQKSIVFRSTNSTAQKQSGIQWWNENGAGVQCAIFGIREAVTQAPTTLAFYTSNNVDTGSNSGQGNIANQMVINSEGEVRIQHEGSSDAVVSSDEVHGIGNSSLNTVTTNLARLVIQERQSNWISFKIGSGTHYGTIALVNGNVSYGGQSSDYRIKENVVNVSNGITLLKQLRPVNFNYTSDSGFAAEEQAKVRIGFIAHEFAEICPTGVIGEKDGMDIWGDCTNSEGKVTQNHVPESKKKDGETWTEKSRKPKYQQIDFSKAVPVLTAALQEAVAKIETLEAEVAALKAA